MAKQATAFDEALSIVSGLAPLDKVRLLERLAAMLENDLSVSAGEFSDDTSAQRMTFQDLAAWLDANPPVEAWGSLSDSDDAGEYVHRMRRQTTVWLEEPGETE